MIKGTYYYIRLVRFKLHFALVKPKMKKKECRIFERVGESVVACVCVGLRENSENERGRGHTHVMEEEKRSWGSANWSS